jgi:hypothetical protein
MAEHVVSIEINNAVNGEQLVLGLSISDRCQFAGSQQLAIAQDRKIIIIY